jgi:hypothetical protein
MKKLLSVFWLLLVCKFLLSQNDITRAKQLYNKIK